MSAEPWGTWLPSTAQIMMASERAILASLDANLQLAIRALHAEHPTLGEEDTRGAGAEPPPPPLALAGSIVILARSLHEVIGSYRAIVEHAMRDADPDDEF